MEKKQISCVQKGCFIAQNLETDSQIFYIIDNQQFRHQCQIKELYGRQIQGCFHGWVILSDRSDSSLLLLWNPLTSKMIRLPPLITEEKYFYQSCLSSPPENKGSVFLLFSVQVPTIFFCQLGPERRSLNWTKISYAKQLQSISGKDDCLLVCPACCNGKVYALALRYYNFVIQIDIVVKDEKVAVNLLPIVHIPCKIRSRCPYNNRINARESYLKGYCMDLFYIEVCSLSTTKKTVVEANLFKLDMTNKMWKEMTDLEDGVFFLERTSGYFSCYYNCAVDSKLGGYIHILGECGKVMYSFHVKDRTMTPFSLSYLVPQRQELVWAMLEWRSESDHANLEDGKDTKGSKKVRRIVQAEYYDCTTGESHLLKMPSHILELISESCIGVDYMKFRATCKSCCLAAPPIQWRNKTTLRNYSLVSPWLMVLDNHQHTITFIDPLFGDKYFIKTPQKLRGGYEIHCSKYGWVLMYKNRAEPQLVFFNPFTGHTHALPNSGYVESFCFSAPPTSPDCIVVGFSRFGSENVYIHFVSGESRWYTHNLRNNLYSDQFSINPYSLHFSTFSGGHIYGLCNNERIEAFKEMNGDGYDWRLVAKKPQADLRHNTSCQVVMNIFY